MIIKISDDLKREEIWANGIELSNIMGMDFVNGKRVSFYPSSEKKLVHTFMNPVLMTDNYKIGKLEPTVRDTLFSLFQCKPRWGEYDGVSTYWDETHKKVWCPSIDNILFAKVLKKYLIGYGFKKGVEIGCGSGFLTKYILEKNKKVEEFLAIDINRDAIKSTEDNIDDSRLKVYCGDALKRIKGEKFDLIICNPPYVPRPGSLDDNPYEGIALMRHLVQEGQNYLNEGEF
ncbi:methyltransferase [archaeon]|nr:methyltransferase [archaeon]